MRRWAPGPVRIRVRALAILLVSVLVSGTATAAPRLALRDLRAPRCWVSAREHAIACPSYQDTRGLGDAGWVVLNVWFADPDRMFETLVVHVGANYSGDVAFEPARGIGAARTRLARFAPAPAARRVAHGAWLATTPRSRLVWRDEVQRDAVLEVRCPDGRVVEDALTITGEEFFVVQAAPWIVVFGRLTSGDAKQALIDVGHRIVDPAALCAGG